MDEGMVIVGAGECGTRAAFALRENGWTGPVVLIGAEPGLPYERPPLSKPAPGAVRRKPICDAGALKAAGIDYHPGTTVRALDPGTRRVVLTDGRVIGFRKLLLATGAHVRRLDCPGAGGVHYFRTDQDAQRLFQAARPGSRVAIIGAGLIGMELAAVLRGRAMAVTVIEAAPAPLARAVPPHFAARLASRHRAEGVGFLFGATVAGIEAGAVLLADGRKVAADLVVGAIGVTPALDLARAAGLAVGNGILTDRRLQCSLPGILAAGDCAAVQDADGGHIRQESWQNAREQAELAARNMLGADLVAEAQPWFWSDQYDLGLQVAGRISPDDRMILRALPEDAEMAFYLRDGRLVAAAGLGPGNSIARDIRLAERLIAAGARPEAADLADPAVNLKQLLKPLRVA